MNKIIFVEMLCLLKCLLGFEETKPYINEFFFKLSDEKFLSDVRSRAETFDFKWLRHVSNFVINEEIRLCYSQRLA